MWLGARQTKIYKTLNLTFFLKMLLQYVGKQLCSDMWKLCVIVYICNCILVIHLFQCVLYVFLFQVQVLRNAGEEVTLTVSFLKRAPAFLKLPLNEDCTCKPLSLGKTNTQKTPKFSVPASEPSVHWGRLTAAFSGSTVAWIWGHRIAKSCSSSHFKQKSAIFAWKTDQKAFGLWCESAKLHVSQWNYIN